MKRYFYFLVLLFLGLSICIQAKNDCDFTVFLQNDSISESDSSCCYGTGTIIKDGAKLCIVTTAKLAEQLDSASYLVCNNKDDLAEKIYLKTLSESGKVQWHYHNSADLAVYPVEVKGTAKKLLKNSAIDAKILVDEKRKKEIEKRKEVEVVGFPIGYGIDRGLNPFIFQSRILNDVSQMPALTDGQICDIVCIQSCTGGACNGSPVFMHEEGKLMKIIGFVQRTVCDEKLNREPVFELVIPAYYFFDIVDKL